jgi:hypothetical protein
MLCALITDALGASAVMLDAQLFRSGSDGGSAAARRPSRPGWTSFAMGCDATRERGGDRDSDLVEGQEASALRWHTGEGGDEDTVIRMAARQAARARTGHDSDCGRHGGPRGPCGPFGNLGSPASAHVTSPGLLVYRAENQPARHSVGPEAGRFTPAAAGPRATAPARQRGYRARAGKTPPRRGSRPARRDSGPPARTAWKGSPVDCW